MKKTWILLPILLVSLGTLLIAPFWGMEWISPRTLFHPQPGDPASMIFWQIRLPRVLLGWVAGAGLAAGGMVFQALFRNALATPFTLGVSSGASLGAAVGIRIGTTLLAGLPAMTAGSMTGAVLAIAVVYGLTRIRRDCSTASMLLAGVAVNFFFSSLILLLQYTSDFHDTFRLLRWLMGGLHLATFGSVLQVLAFVILGSVVIAACSGELNLLTIGEELALSRGVSVARTKLLLFVTVSIMIGAIVSVCGPIGFVGLMCPHICRMLVGPDHRTLLPASILFGGGFLVLCDTVARTIFAPTELPVGICTSFLGGPFFLWLLLRPHADEQ